jgi:hypothetical protein
MRSREQFISYQQINVLSSSPSKTPYILDQWSTYGVSKGLAQWTTNSHQLVNFLVQVSLSLLTSKEKKDKGKFIEALCNIKIHSTSYTMLLICLGHLYLYAMLNLLNYMLL